MRRRFRRRQLRVTTYSFIMLANVAVIAFAGTTGNTRLFQLLARLGGNRAVARRVLFAWLAGNLFLGSQLSWILRPFIGSPKLAGGIFPRDGIPRKFLRRRFPFTDDRFSTD